MEIEQPEEIAVYQTGIPDIDKPRSGGNPVLFAPDSRDDTCRDKTIREFSPQRPGKRWGCSSTRVNGLRWCKPQMAQAGMNF